MCFRSTAPLVWDMDSSSLFSVVLTTLPSEQLADDLAAKLCERKLAACVQMQPIRSTYRWKGKLEQSNECLLFIKTRRELFSQLQEFIKSQHPYEVPEIIEIPIQGGLGAYLQWLDDSTR